MTTVESKQTDRSEFPTEEATHIASREAGHRVIPFSRHRRMVAASASAGRKQNNIHLIIEADISEPRRLMARHREQTGERLSLTAFVIACLGRAIAKHPRLNAFRRGRKLVLLGDVTIGAMVEREFGGELIPEPFGIRNADRRSFREIHSAIRDTQSQTTDALGQLNGADWIRLIPGFLMRLFVRLASRNISMMERYGAVCVTAVGMFGCECMTPVPVVGGATVGVSVGGIVPRAVVVDGSVGMREHLCLTVTVNHDIVDGAPAARFAKDFADLLADTSLLARDIEPQSP